MYAVYARSLFTAIHRSQLLSTVKRLLDPRQPVHGIGFRFSDSPRYVRVYTFDLESRRVCEFCIDLIEWSDLVDPVDCCFKGKMMNWPNKRFCLYTRVSHRSKVVEYYRFSLRRFLLRFCQTGLQRSSSDTRETFEYHKFTFGKFLFGRGFKVD